MEEEKLQALLKGVQSGAVNVEDALQQLRGLPYETVDNFARLDHHRGIRQGFPEVIFTPGKTPEQFVRIFQRLAERSDRVLATRVDSAYYEQVRRELPDGAVYHSSARLVVLDRHPDRVKKEGVVVLCAGTADFPIAEEAVLTADLMGSQVTRLYDVGVAGLHRLLDQLPVLQSARVIIVAAGMEGALPSVVAGLVQVPVIAIPTSVGYGASFGGLAALLAMLNSCANGVAVVNIDNGFGAGYLANQINHMKTD